MNEKREKMKNILITSAGRRVSLVQEFKKTALDFSEDIKVFTTDMEPRMAPACHVSDASFKVPPITEKCCIDQIVEICKKNDIGILIPTIDTCLPYLAENRQRFEEIGTHVIVSSIDFVNICCDKRKSFKFFNANGIETPRMIDINCPEFPMFAKPYDGSGSNNIHTIMSEDDLSVTIRNNSKLMFMEYVDLGEFREFTVDMYYGRDNHVKCIVPRERIEVRGGEVSKAVTRNNFLVDFLKERFENLPGVFGCICVQLFYRERDNTIVGCEINPRFGGGYPLSFHAGANFPRMIMQEYFQDKTLEYREDWRDNLMMLRYDAEVIVESQA